MTTRQTLYFAQPYQVEVHNESMPAPEPHQVVVKTVLSAISAGTELLFYRGQVPPGMAVDTSITGMQQTVKYPLAYGYCNVGEVVAHGNQVDPTWQGRRVFAFHPHTSAFISEPVQLHPIPDAISYEQAVLLPTMETAVNFVMDAKPILGERVLTIGLGIVGLLTAYLLNRFPVERVYAVDGYANRIALAQQWGINALHSLNDLTTLQKYNPDLILELSSNPAALTSALDYAGFGTRIVVGSWYGDKVANLPLGGNFHRNRVQLISSQVSTLDGQFSNRWDKQRRLKTAWQQLEKLPVQELISHRLPLSSASVAYALLDQHPEQTLQILFTY